MKLIDLSLLNSISAQAKDSPRLRMNFNFHQSLEDKCHRMLNAVEPGTQVPIHRHPTKDESFVILRGKVRSTTYNDDGSVIESVVLCAEDGIYGVDIPKNVWHKLESLEPGSVIFECKEGPFVPHEAEGILELKREDSTLNTNFHESAMNFLKGIWAFCSFVFVPQRCPKEEV